MSSWRMLGDLLGWIAIGAVVGAVVGVVVGTLVGMLWVIVRDFARGLWDARGDQPPGYRRTDSYTYTTTGRASPSEEER